jgi:hypothetical protein
LLVFGFFKKIEIKKLLVAQFSTFSNSKDTKLWVSKNCLHERLVTKVQSHTKVTYKSMLYIIEYKLHRISTFLDFQKAKVYMNSNKNTLPMHKSLAMDSPGQITLISLS